jgi:hypothetical protein
MSDSPSPAGINTEIASAARVYDYLLGGKTNYDIDRQVAEASGVAIGGIGRARAAVRANRAFLGEAVRRLVASGVRQFLDIGSGLPTENNVHEVAQRAARECRIVYVDNDPIVLLHAETLLDSTSEGATSYINGDLVDPGTIVLRAEATLDFEEPIAVMLVSMLHFFRDEQDPVGLVARLVDAVPSGSHLVISHLTADFEPLMRDVAESPGDQAEYEFILRTGDELARFFDGLELIEPGLVAMNEWLPADAPGGLRTWAKTFYGAIGRKP